MLRRTLWGALSPVRARGASSQLSTGVDPRLNVPPSRSMVHRLLHHPPVLTTGVKEPVVVR
jgi:hypothetical protein